DDLRLGARGARAWRRCWLWVSGWNGRASALPAPSATFDDRGLGAEDRTDPFQVGDARVGRGTWLEDGVARRYGGARRSGVGRAVGVRARSARCGTGNRCEAEQRGAANRGGGDQSFHYSPLAWL